MHCLTFDSEVFKMSLFYYQHDDVQINQSVKTQTAKGSLKWFVDLNNKTWELKVAQISEMNSIFMLVKKLSLS